MFIDDVENNVTRNVLEILLNNTSLNTLLVSRLKKTHGESGVISVADVKDTLNTIRQQFFELLQQPFINGLEKEFQYNGLGTWKRVQEIKEKFNRYDAIMKTSRNFLEFQAMQIIKWAELQTADLTIHDLKNKLPDINSNSHDETDETLFNKEAIRISNMIFLMMSVISETLN